MSAKFTVHSADGSSREVTEDEFQAAINGDLARYNGGFAPTNDDELKAILDRQFEVVTVTKNIEKYPQFAADSERFPELVRRVSDEVAVFVVQSSTRNYWPAMEFFMMTRVKYFMVVEGGV